MKDKTEQNRLVMILKNWWVFLSFTVVYIPGLIYALGHGPQSVSSNPVAFLTSWFNPSEDWDITPLRVGIILNYIIPVITLFSAEAYSNWNIFLSKRYFSIEATYIIGILTTYIMSGLGWFFSGTAGNGSSLIAFCLYATFTVKIIIDSVGGFQNRRRNVSAKFEVTWGVFITLILAILVVPFFFVSVIGYIAQREFNHFVGLGVFCLLSALLIADRIQYQKKLDS